MFLRPWICSIPFRSSCRSFAILVNFNLDPKELLEETKFVRTELLKATEWSHQISRRAQEDYLEESSSKPGAEESSPFQLFRLRHEALAKIKLDKAFDHYERLEGRVLLPRFSQRVIEDEFLIRGRFTNAYTRQVMNLLKNCFPDMEDIVMRAWTFREKLHRDISMNRRFLEKEGLEIVDLDWNQLLHWGYRRK